MKTGVKSVLAAALALAAIVTSAEARINGPRLDSFSVGCGLLQDEADRLIAEYRDASNQRRDEILTRLRQIGQNWNDIGCKTVFGDIALRVTPQVMTPAVQVQPLVIVR